MRNKRIAIVVAAGAVVLGLAGAGTAIATSDEPAQESGPTQPAPPGWTPPEDGVACALPSAGEREEAVPAPEGVEVVPAQPVQPGETVPVPDGAETVPAQPIEWGETVPAPPGWTPPAEGVECTLLPEDAQIAPAEKAEERPAAEAPEGADSVPAQPARP